MKKILTLMCLSILFPSCDDKPYSEIVEKDDGPLYDQAYVPFERILSATGTPNHWLTYSGNLSGHRYSRLDQINTSNVKDLRTKWVYQMNTQAPVETSPIVVDGIMYITSPPSTVLAIDASTGNVLWKYDPLVPDNVLFLGFPPVNRGVAVLDDMVYVGTLDAHLVALDAKSGTERWKVKVAENRTGHAITAAPLIVKDMVITGISGGEAGIRGFLDAYDSKTGAHVWRLQTVPEKGAFGNDTWAGDSWKTGGAPTWLTGSYDPELNLLYWGTGNPAPDWNGDARAGDNLYSCSVLAINPDTGELIWYFQFTPHDVHDWDSNHIPVLVDAVLGDQTRKLLIMANRNAFYYILDRRTGEYLLSRPYVKQTWAERIDVDGRPVVLPNSGPTEEGNLIYPSLQGATNWFSPSFSERTGLFYVPVRDMGAYYFKTDVDYEPGKYFLGGGEQTLDGDMAKGYVKALDVETGKEQWAFDLHSPPWAGVMATAGGLVFGGTNEGNFFALDDESGELVWDFQTGGPIRTNPISFAVDGKQCIAISGGNALFVFNLP
ncbi:MAG: PQQ-dependent dehydrogenase, methanol/ethanol family [Bacteroidetes bacterium]|nr:MAG: PQQ-dependent dehydrogenase, methanol/ethanol family [Bacteroidota bacterium]